MNPVPYTAIGLLSFVTGWGAILFLLAKWGADKGKSISRHAAAHRQAYLFMAVLETVSLVSLAVFLVWGLAPAYDLPVAFSVCGIGVSLGLLIAAWVPHVDGIKGKIHSAGALTSAVLFVPAVLLIAVAGHSSVAVQVINYFAAAVMIISLILYFTYKPSHRYHLYFQAANILAFDGALLAAAFL